MADPDLPEEAAPGPRRGCRAPIRAIYAPFHIINTYHLFAAVTRERIEPEVQTLAERGWIAHDLAYKPGDPRRAPLHRAPPAAERLPPLVL